MANYVWAVDFDRMLSQFPGLLDRGVMLGIPVRTSVDLLVAMADILPPQCTIDYPSVYDIDPLKDAIGFCLADNAETGDPQLPTDPEALCDIVEAYEYGMIMGSVILRSTLPLTLVQTQVLTIVYPLVVYLGVSTDDDLTNCHNPR